MTGEKIIELMGGGFALHSSRFGFWLIDPVDSRCINVHFNAAKSLVKKRKIKRVSGSDWDAQWVAVKLAEGDEVEATRNIPRGLASKGEVMTVTEDPGNGWFGVKPLDKKKSGFLAKESDIRIFKPNSINQRTKVR